MTAGPHGNRMLRWFSVDHLPHALQKTSKPFQDLALYIDSELPESAEKTTGLRKLLEAKDCIVRATLDTGPGGER